MRCFSTISLAASVLGKTVAVLGSVVQSHPAVRNALVALLRTNFLISTSTRLTCIRRFCASCPTPTRGGIPYGLRTFLALLAGSA